MATALTNHVMFLIGDALRAIRLGRDTLGEDAPSVCYWPDDPEGWIQIAGRDYRYVAPGDILHETVLEASRAGVATVSGLRRHLEAGGIHDSEGRDPDLTPWADACDFAGLDLGGGLGLVVIRTNSGLQYGYAPVSDEFAAFGCPHDYSPRYDTVSEARDAAMLAQAAQ